MPVAAIQPMLEMTIIACGKRDAPPPGPCIHDGCANSILCRFQCIPWMLQSTQKDAGTDIRRCLQAT